MRSDFSGATSDQELVSLWLAGRPTSTQEKYAPVAQDFLAKTKPIKDLTAADAITWKEALLGKEATRARWVSTVKSLLSFAWRIGYTSVNVGRILRCVKVTQNLHEKFIEEETLRLIIEKCPEGRDKLLLRLLYSGGFRISEVVKLRFIDLGKGRVSVVGKGTKTRTVVVPEAVLEGLRKLQEKNGLATDPVFTNCRTGEQLGVRAAREIVYQAADRIGDRVRPHQIRHTHASLAMDNGCPLHVLSKSLGHANISTTSVYLHVKPTVGSSQFLSEM